MLFTSISFLYVFLPIVLIIYFITPKRVRNYVLLVSSLLFYFIGEPKYVLILVFSSISDYIHALIIEKYRGEKKSTYALISSIVINVSLLVFFKYADFFIGIINSVFHLNIAYLYIPLPIGISFFTFQTMSYSIDVYRGDVEAEKKFSTLFTYVCLFPQLIAGPIVRFKDVSDKLHSRMISYEDVYIGVKKITFGLFKKIIIANNMGQLGVLFEGSTDKSVLFFWLYSISFALQIYFDFSGYSDMAIGLGRIFGFKFPENFNYPFISTSVTEFWRRWHMTLGSWFRDYLYIPLGGNRKGKLNNLRNILFVWMLTGLWHGASLNFLLWGLYFGLILIFEKLLMLKILEKLPRMLRHIYVLFIADISFVIFNSESMKEFIYNIKGMFGFLEIDLVSTEAIYYLKSYMILFILAILLSTELFKKIPEKKFYKLAEPVLIGGVLLVTTSFLVEGGFNPFLYFRF